jgi:hypothetical protein
MDIGMVTTTVIMDTTTITIVTMECSTDIEVKVLTPVRV